MSGGGTRPRLGLKGRESVAFALEPSAFGMSLGTGPGATVPSLGPLGHFCQNPTRPLNECIRRSGFADAASEAPIA